MPVGGMKAETCTLPPPSTSASSALLAELVPSVLRVRTRRGRTDEGGDVGEDGLEEMSSRIGGIRQSAKESGERGGGGYRRGVSGRGIDGSIDHASRARARKESGD